jgi:predicted O-methyltransferase YrrM
VTLGRTTRRNSKRLPWCELLFRTLRELRPERAIELGTCVGISASFQAAALELNGAGHLVTLEGQEAFARIARANLEELGLAGRATLVVGRFDETLPRVLAEPLGPVDFVFLDGNHTEEATWRYYEALLPAMRERGVLVFDDIDWSAGMRRVWTRVREDSRLGAAIDLTKIGVGVVGTSTGDVVPDQFTVAI